jgi:hypothetical protein
MLAYTNQPSHHFGCILVHVHGVVVEGVTDRNMVHLVAL